jgi:hypothetical protein
MKYILFLIVMGLIGIRLSIAQWHRCAMAIAIGLVASMMTDPLLELSLGQYTIAMALLAFCVGFVIINFKANRLKWWEILIYGMLFVLLISLYAIGKI